MRRRMMVAMIVVSLLAVAVPALAQAAVQPYSVVPEATVDYEPLTELAIDVGGIALITGLLFFLVQKSMPKNAAVWYFDDHAWLVNLSVVVVSVGISLLGAWLNVMAFQPRTLVEYIWKGLFSAAVATLGYEFAKNLGR